MTNNQGHMRLCAAKRQMIKIRVQAFSKPGITIFLRMTVPFVTAQHEIFHCTHHPVIPKSDLYFTFCSTLNALSKRTSK